MNFNSAYNYLISLQSLPRKEYMRDPKHCSIYLKRLQFFLDLLGNPEKSIPHYIHVTGTSGKGSVCLMLNSILIEAGYKTGLSISPHPTTITERWQIGNKQMTKPEFIELIKFIKPKLDEYIRTTPYDMLSFFEICEAIGFLYFKKHKVKWAILEVGLGGRYDASNIIPYKDIAVITNIGLDHTNILGNSRKLIAYEKAGIIKPGCVVFTEERDKKILEVIERECSKTKSSLKIFNFSAQGGSASGRQFSIFKQFLNDSILKKFGKHQVDNAKLCIQIAQHLKIPDNKIRLGLKKNKLPLRMEIISKNPTIILDSAHNPDKMKTTVSSVSPLLVGEGSGVRSHRAKDLHLTIAFTADKNITKMISQLSKLKPKSIACTRYTNNPFRQPANPKDLADKFKKLLNQPVLSDSLRKTKIEMFLDPKDALDWSLKKQKAGDIILVTGSIFLSGEIKIASYFLHSSNPL